MAKPIHILFLCVANSARSQLAEGLARQIFGSEAVIESAGTRPSKVNPFAIASMTESGIDISKQRSKSIESLSPEFMTQLDFVITLCAEEVCPMVVAKAQKFHWPFSDPAGQGGTDAEQLERFAKTRDELQKKISEFYKSRLKS
jgi:arsenate reductase